MLKLYGLCLSKIRETDEISFTLMGLVPLVSGTSIYPLLPEINGIYKKFQDVPMLLEKKFGKTEAEKGVYFMTFIFSLLLALSNILIHC